MKPADRKQWISELADDLAKGADSRSAFSKMKRSRLLQFAEGIANTIDKFDLGKSYNPDHYAFLRRIYKGRPGHLAHVDELERRA